MTADPIPRRANHDRNCRTCHGSGWADGPPIYGTAHGDPVTYPTLTPCTDLDRRGWDPYYDEPIPLTDPRAVAALNAGIAQGAAELEQMRRSHDRP